MRQRTIFNLCLEDKLKDAGFEKEFRKAGEVWDVAIQLVSLRKKSGFSQKELAKRVGTSQQQISRLESPSYRGHSLSMLRRVADVLGADVHVKIQAKKQQSPPVMAGAKAIYRVMSKDFEDIKSILLKKTRVRLRLYQEVAEGV